MARSSNTLRRVLAVAAAVAIASGTIAAASSSASASQPTADPPGVAAAKKVLAYASVLPTKISVTVPLSKRPPTGKKVWFIGANIASVQQGAEGFKAAAAALGWSPTVVYYASNQADANGLMLQAIQNGADYIATVGVDPTAVQVGMDAARKANVPTFFGSANATPAGKANWVFSNPSSLREWVQRGVLSSAATVANSNGHANVVIFNVPVFASFQAWVQSYKENLAKFCPPPACVVSGELNVPLPDISSGKALSSLVAYLRAHPDVNQIACSSMAFCQAIGPLAQAAGINVGNSGIGVVAATMNDTSIPFVANGTVQSALASAGVYISWQQVDAMARYSVGDSLVPNWSARVPNYMFTAAKTTPTTPYYYGPKNYTGQFKKLWHR